MSSESQGAVQHQFSKFSTKYTSLHSQAACLIQYTKQHILPYAVPIKPHIKNQKMYIQTSQKHRGDRNLSTNQCKQFFIDIIEICHILKDMSSRSISQNDIKHDVFISPFQREFSLLQPSSKQKQSQQQWQPSILRICDFDQMRTAVSSFQVDPFTQAFKHPYLTKAEKYREMNQNNQIELSKINNGAQNINSSLLRRIFQNGSVFDFSLGKNDLKNLAFKVVLFYLFKGQIQLENPNVQKLIKGLKIEVKNPEVEKFLSYLWNGKIQLKLISDQQQEKQKQAFYVQAKNPDFGLQFLKEVEQKIKEVKKHLQNIPNIKSQSLYKKIPQYYRNVLKKTDASNYNEKKLKKKQYPLNFVQDFILLCSQLMHPQQGMRMTIDTFQLKFVKLLKQKLGQSGKKIIQQSVYFQAQSKFAENILYLKVFRNFIFLTRNLRKNQQKLKQFMRNQFKINFNIPQYIQLLKKKQSELSKNKIKEEMSKIEYQVQQIKLNIKQNNDQIVRKIDQKSSNQSQKLKQCYFYWKNYYYSWCRQWEFIKTKFDIKNDQSIQNSIDNLQGKLQKLQKSIRENLNL